MMFLDQFIIMSNDTHRSTQYFEHKCLTHKKFFFLIKQISAFKEESHFRQDRFNFDRRPYEQRYGLQVL